MTIPKRHQLAKQAEQERWLYTEEMERAFAMHALYVTHRRRARKARAEFARLTGELLRHRT